MDVHNVEELFNRYKVDLAIGGHVHDVMVTQPVFNQTVVQPASTGAYDAPIYLTVGNGGHAAVDPGKPAAWAQFVSGAEGWTEIEALSREELRVTLYTIGNVSDARGAVNRTVLYNFSIQRSWPRQWGSNDHWMASRSARLAAEAENGKKSREDEMRSTLRQREEALGELDHGARRAAMRLARVLGLGFDLTELPLSDNSQSRK